MRVVSTAAVNVLLGGEELAEDLTNEVEDFNTVATGGTRLI